MGELTGILTAIERGDALASEQLLPLVYDELRRLAAAWLRQERAGQTLQATALVHEAYLRLVGPEESTRWAGRGHFFAAAAEAMRRILVDRARRKRSLKCRGLTLDRQDLDDAQIAGPTKGVDVLELERGPRPPRRPRRRSRAIRQAPLLRRHDAARGRRGPSGSP